MVNNVVPAQVLFLFEIRCKGTDFFCAWQIILYKNETQAIFIR